MNPGNGLQRISPTEIEGHSRNYTFVDMKAMAEEVAKSGMFKMTAPQVLTLMMLAQSEGIHPIRAMMRYHVFNGRPSMRADAMQAEFQKGGGRIEWVKDTETECEAIFYHEQYCKDGKAVSFTMDDAKRAKLTGKDVWQQHPRNMLRARVITNGVRMIDPGVIMGIYTPDEIEEFTTPVPVEQAAHASLTSKLAARHAPTRERHEPVADVVAELKAQETAQKPPAEPKSDCRGWIEGTLESFNQEYLAASPAGEKSIHANQVVNHVIKEAVKLGITDELLITNAAGKRDTRAVGKEILRLWDVDEGWVMRTVGEYLYSKLPEAVAVGADDDLDSIDDGFPKSE